MPRTKSAPVPPAAKARRNLKTTTVRLPRRLFDEARYFVAATDVGSFNDLLIQSLEKNIRQLKRAQIDAKFAAMRNDAAYQKEARTIADQFAKSDWQALEMAEKEQL